MPNHQSKIENRKSPIPSRRQFLRVTGAAAATLALARLAPLFAADAARRPNVLFILADDLGYGDVGCYGGRDIPTPHIDALAAAGLRFTDGYASAPVCAPSRAGFLTGRYQQRFGLEENPGAVSNLNRETYGLPLSERTIADEMKSAGYATGIVGKWHLGVAERFGPLRRGFSECFAFLEAWHNYVNLRQDPRIIYRNDKPHVETAEYLTDALTREGVEFIRRNRARPWFLFMSYSAPHTPIQATGRYLDRFPHIADPARRTYAAMVSALDDGVGELMKALRELDLEENTLVFFVSDNGAPLHLTSSVTGQERPIDVGSNAPFSGRKGQLLEGGIRVPFIAHWKGRIAPGVCPHPVTMLDILPTSLAVAGAAPPAGRTIDGVNLLPLLSGQSNAAPHEILFWRIGTQAAVRRGNWKLVRVDGGPWRLYDLAVDAVEANDLAQANRKVYDELLAAYRGWEAQLKG